MTTYTITIQDVKRNEVLSLLESVPSHCSFKLDSSAGDELKVKGVVKAGVQVGRIAGKQILSLTGKKATEGSNREAILLTMEKLEKKHGIGTVTRDLLRNTCSQMGQDSQIIYQLVRDGYLKTL